MLVNVFLCVCVHVCLFGGGRFFLLSVQGCC